MLQQAVLTVAARIWKLNDTSYDSIFQNIEVWNLFTHK